MITNSKLYKEIKDENQHLKELLAENGYTPDEIVNLDRETQIKLDEQWECEAEDIRLKELNE